MTFTYFGIALFLVWEWVKFIKESPAKQAVRPKQTNKRGIPYVCERSIHPERMLLRQGMALLNN